MTCTVNFAVSILNDDNGLGGHLDGALRRCAGAIGHVVVLGPRVVNAPQKIVKSVAIEYVSTFTIGIGAK